MYWGTHFVTMFVLPKVLKSHTSTWNLSAWPVVRFSYHSSMIPWSQSRSFLCSLTVSHIFFFSTHL